MRTPESLIRIGLSLGVCGMLNACTPSKSGITPKVSAEKSGLLMPYPADDLAEPDLSKEGIMSTLASFRLTHPSCFVEDVEQELDDLIAGRETFVPGIDGHPDSEKEVKIVRAANKVVLRREAEEIRKNNLDRHESAVKVAGIYLDLARMELAVAELFRDAPGSTFVFLADCHSVKSISLNGSVILE